MALELAEPDLLRLLGGAELAIHKHVESTEQLWGGYTAQLVLRLRLGGGASCVLKAAPPAAVDARMDWPSELEREIELYRAHSELDPWRPKFLADFRTKGWRALLMEDLGASLRPPPWTETAIDLVADGLAAMHSATASQRGCVVHGDVRSDNLFVAPRRGLILCDWAESDVGTCLEDAIYWAIGVALESGGPAPDVFAKYTAFAGEPDPGAISSALAKLELMNQHRLQRRGEPAAVRELRSRELDVMKRWREDRPVHGTSG
jgi:hypothetical protein